LALTIARLPGSRRPGLLVAGSLLLRLAVVGAALVAIARWLPPAGVLGAALGVLVASTVLVRAAMRGDRIDRSARFDRTVGPGRHRPCRSEVSRPWT
jgi:CHASE2 domain-containing sensor protein